MLLLSITGYLLIPLTEKGNISRMKEYRQLQTGKAVDRLYELMFTLREMRNKATSSFLVTKDLFIATALVAPSKKSLEAYDAGTRVNKLTEIQCTTLTLFCFHGCCSFYGQKSWYGPNVKCWNQHHLFTLASKREN